MKLLSIDYIPGTEIEALGMVKGTVVQTKNVGRDFMAGMKTLVGGEIVGYDYDEWWLHRKATAFVPANLTAVVVGGYAI